MATRPPQPAPKSALRAAGSGIVPAWVAGLQKHRHLIVPVSFIMLLVVILVPLPTWMMDVLISFNISLSVIILLTTIYMAAPLDFSVFPSLLLATTLFRLVLNVACTRLILSAEASTPEEAMGMAGEVIAAFANFVAGDNLFVGVVIFLILIVVQFVVITKGATRISEVAARFTLDAMPGKQMAIDADLNAGIIDEAEARRRREKISQEADFFGAMDGASKFVRGDAVAGIIITIINIAGGFAIGTIERGWPAAQTAHIFTMLTIGEGLTSQVPSFVIAIASALIVTRSGSKQQLGNELTGQLISQPTGLGVTAVFLGLLAFTPLPTIPLLATAGGLGFLAWSLRRTTRMKAVAAEQTAKAQATKQTAEGPPPEQLLKLDTLELEVGYGLVSLVDTAQGGDLLDRISAIRRQLAVDLGFILPPVRIRDNIQLGPNEYRVKIKGAVLARGETIPGRLMAMDSGIASGPLPGGNNVPTKEPAFGLDAWWIEPGLKSRAEAMNYTVVDPTSVLATHITEIARANAGELLTREEVNNLVAQLKEKSPKLIEEAIPTIVKVGELQKVLQNLLRERVPIRDLETIIETLADWGGRTKDLDVLTEYVRNALRRTISQQHATPIEPGGRGAGGSGGAGAATHRIVCVTLDPVLEDQINAHIDRSAGATTVNMPMRTANQFTAQVVKGLQSLIGAGHQPVVITSPPVRAVVRQLLEPQLPNIAVLGYNEIVPTVEVESMALIPALPTAAAAAAA